MEEDRISQLPDPLICQILNHLSTKQLVQTSVLSTRWRNLWLSVPSLELNFDHFPDFDTFVSFGNRFFESNRVSYLRKLELTIIDEEDVVDDVSCLTAWMDAAAKRKIQHLEYHLVSQYLQVHTNQLSLGKCKRLVYLRLSDVTFDDAELLSFPYVKTLRLEYVLFPNIAAFEKLVSRCPVLEDLVLFFYKNDDKAFHVHSWSLKRLTLIRESDFAVPGVVIDAPLLYSLTICDLSSESVIVNNLQSNARLDISLHFGLGDFDESRRSNIRRFLSGISMVGDMSLTAESFQRIVQYSKVEQLPQFGLLSSLIAGLYASDLICLPTFLESCPNLKSLMLDWEAGNEEMSQTSFSYVPKCMQSSLEFITITVPITECVAEMKLVRYFLENSSILKKLSLCLAKRNSWTEKYIREDLHKIPRGSAKCEVHVSVHYKTFNV